MLLNLSLHPESVQTCQFCALHYINVLFLNIEGSNVEETKHAFFLHIPHFVIVCFPWPKSRISLKIMVIKMHLLNSNYTQQNCIVRQPVCTSQTQNRSKPSL